jgi:hypothetical protein
MIRENFDEITMCNVSKRRLNISTRGGSTGNPLKVYHDKKFPNDILTWRYLE